MQYMHASDTSAESHAPPSFFFNNTATTEISTLSLHAALPISAFQGKGSRRGLISAPFPNPASRPPGGPACLPGDGLQQRSEEHTSELQSLAYLVCRLLLEKKKEETKTNNYCF